MNLPTPTTMRTQRGTFDLREPDPAAINIHDVARSLARLPRYLGHTETAYSVAQHSVEVALRLPDDELLDVEGVGVSLRFIGLMHDAPEAYTGDITRPMKTLIGPRIKQLEQVIWLAFCHRYHLPEELPPAVKEADDRMLATEQRDLFSPPQINSVHEPYEYTVRPWGEQTARANWLKLFRQLKPKGVLG